MGERKHHSQIRWFGSVDGETVNGVHHIKVFRVLLRDFSFFLNGHDGEKTKQALWGTEALWK